jgi:Secretion system C-terminal sorting domain
MMNFNQFKSSLTMLLVLLGMQLTAQTIWTETFSNQTTSTTNWVTTGSVNAGTLNWEWTSDVNAGFQDPNGVFSAFTAPTASTGYFLFNSDGNGDFAHDVRLSGVGVPANCTGKNNVRLKFFTEFAYFSAGSVLEVGVSTDGTTWAYTEVLPTLAPNAVYENLVDIDLPAADNKPQVWLQFRWTGQFEYHVKIDDVELYDVPPAMPAVTFRVNMATQTVDPGGVFLAGSFNGFTNEAMTNAGNGVWTLTKTLTQGTAYAYKFKNGANGWENAPGLISCGTNDGSGNINRAYTPGTANEVLPAVCFNSCSPCVFTGCASNPDAIICDNFDTYVTTQKIAQQSATNWGVWSNGAGGGPEDGVIVTTPVSSAPNSLKVEATAAGGGPMDLILKLQNKATGHYSLKWKMFIPTGKQAYFNYQNIVPIPATGNFSGEVYFTNGSKGFIINAGDTLRKFSFPYATWFTIEQKFDLDNNTLDVLVNGASIGLFAYAGNCGAIDFFGVNNTYQYFVDDVEYISLPPVVYNADNCANAINLNPYVGLGEGVQSSVGPYDITNATTTATDPTTGFECQLATATTVDPLQGNHWFTFNGDGGTYILTSRACGVDSMPNGDTQFALYSGSCGNFTPIACNDDIDFDNDIYASTLTVPTVAGTTYYLMVDSWGGENGEYCLDMAKIGSVTCAQAKVGTNSVSNNGNVCFGENLSGIIVIEPTTYVIPNAVPGVSGHTWVLSQAPLDPMVWPGTLTAGINSLPISSTVGPVGLTNTGVGFPAGIYYTTSVVCAGGSVIDNTAANTVDNVDMTNGCFFIGTSHQITLWPEMDAITATRVITNVTAPGNNGAINVTPLGGSAGVIGTTYEVLWSNGKTTEDLTGLAPGTYTVTITEPSGCVDNFIATYVVTGFVSTTDPEVVSSLSVSPNPSAGIMSVRMDLERSTEVRIDIVNALGQVVITRNLGTTNIVNQELDLSNLADGTYFMRATIDTETAIRTVVLNR